MKVFRRPRRRAPGMATTGDASDDELLAQLAAQSDLNAPRHWVHYLYCADESAAHQAAEVVAAAGWIIQRFDTAAQGPGWVLIAERDDAVLSPQAVRAARSFFEQVAGRVPGGNYDGWEASV